MTVPFNEEIVAVNGWNGTFTANGMRLSVGNMSYNGSIAAGATLGGIGFQVTADSGLAVAP